MYLRLELLIEKYVRRLDVAMDYPGMAWCVIWSVIDENI